MKRNAGIHHITAIVGDTQENVDFYAGVLGLRLVKQTVNFDDPDTYHLYFGNQGGSPGTIITFFPWGGAPQGTIGGGQVGYTTYAVPKGALPFWEQRLEDFGVETVRTQRFQETVLQFRDVHGLQLELVERMDGALNTWNPEGALPDHVAIKGFGGAILYSVNPRETMETLEKTLGLQRVAEEDGRVRFRSTGDIGNIIDVERAPMDRGRLGVGTVHHIAWRAKDDADQLEWQDLAARQGHGVTAVRDRNYFNAIYFREPGHILFEIATDPPGFAHDESLETMGTALMLPAQYEKERARLEKTLPPIRVRAFEEVPHATY